jgi:excisionase family DNA binding protein
MTKQLTPTFVSVATAALATGLSLTAIYKHIHEKNLPATKLTGFREFMITKEALQEFIAARARGEYTHQWKQAREGKPARTNQQQLMETCIGNKVLTVPSEVKE